MQYSDYLHAARNHLHWLCLQSMQPTNQLFGDLSTRYPPQPISRPESRSVPRLSGYVDAVDRL